jgi:hypothetical protein
LFKEIPSAHAATAIEYKAVRFQDTKTIQAALDQYGRQGWQLVAVEATIGHLIFKK